VIILPLSSDEQEQIILCIRIPLCFPPHKKIGLPYDRA
jgi:hypothetical protein